MRRIDGVERRSIPAAVREIRMLICIQHEHLDVSAFVALLLATGSGNERLKRPMQTRQRSVRGHLKLERRCLLQRKSLVQEIDRPHMRRVNAIETADGGRTRLTLIASGQRTQRDE